MIDTAMLAAMREAISELLPDTCRIITVTQTADGEGGVTETYGTSSAVVCRLDVISGREQVAGGALQPFTGYKLSLPYDTTITEANRVLYSGTTYAVVNAPVDKSWNVVRRVDLERL